MKVQMERKGVREGKMDKKGEKTGEGGATLSLECLWFCENYAIEPLFFLDFLLFIQDLLS